MMDAAVAKQVSYRWLCDLYREGVRDGRSQSRSEVLTNAAHAVGRPKEKG